VLSLHPYDVMTAPEPSNWQPPVNVAADRQLMVANGDAGKPIWFTEFGWFADPNMADPVPAEGVTPAEQATYTANFIASVGLNYKYVTQVFVFNGVDAIGDSEPNVRYAGVLDFNLAPKPVYWAIAHLYGQ
jgi:hypothetical protein